MESGVTVYGSDRSVTSVDNSSKFKGSAEVSAEELAVRLNRRYSLAIPAYMAELKAIAQAVLRPVNPIDPVEAEKAIAMADATLIALQRISQRLARGGPLNT